MFNKSSDSNLVTATLYLLHSLSSGIDVAASLIWGRYFRRAGIRKFFFLRGSTSNERAFDELLSLLDDAIDIKLALGEMGHRLMENEKMLERLVRAYQTNQANITIVHGPRVDPETHRVFELAREGILSLYCMPNYRSHHFFLITSKNGKTTAIEEARHLETRWKKVGGQWKESAHSYVRTYFVASQPYRLQNLRQAFRIRRTTASRIYESPALEENQQPKLAVNNFDVWRRLFWGTWWIFKLKFYYQPKSIIDDSSEDIDLHEKWIAESKRHESSRTSIYSLSLPIRAQRIFNGRISPDATDCLRNSIELAGSDTAFNAEDFRNFHMLEFGLQSIGYFEFSTETFMWLVTNSVDTLSVLFEKLPMLVQQQPSLKGELRVALERNRQNYAFSNG